MPWDQGRMAAFGYFCPPRAAFQNVRNLVATSTGRCNTGVKPFCRGFTFNQYLIVDDEPLLYHTGLRQMFALTRQAIATVMPVEKLRYIGFSHVEADECGALNNFLNAAPQATPLCSDIAAMVSVGDMVDRPPRAMADGESVELGRHTVTWTATPHLPHGRECGHLYEQVTRHSICGGLFTQFGAEHPAVTENDILKTSEKSRTALDYCFHARNCTALMNKLAVLEPRILACMHGAAWCGDGGALLRALGQRLAS